MTAALRRASYDDVLNAPPDMVAELIAGELHLQPRPWRRHAGAASVLGMDLGGVFQRGRGGPGGWVFYDEPELHLGRDVLVPDLAAWRKERSPTSPDNELYFVVVPDWVCEVLSPSTARKDRRLKMAIYARERVRHSWLVDPDARTLEVYRLEGDKWLQLSVHAEDERVRAEPFDAVELEVGALWPDAEAVAR